MSSSPVMSSASVLAFTSPASLSLKSAVAKPSARSPNIPPSISMSTSAPTTSATPLSRRAFLLSSVAVSAVLLAPLPSMADQSSMTGDYKVDAAQLLGDMRSVCDLSRGAPGMTDAVGKTRKEMNDFVALYRRNNKVSGFPSFSTLYTAINTLSGHYSSYGSSYPVPEKRKKRLSQQFSDIDRALSRGR